MTRLLLLILITLPAFGSSAYTLQDLEVLAQEGAHEEFFAHALDVRPSERQETWKSMVSTMADGLSRKVLAKSNLSESDFNKIEELYKWPSLKTDDIFRTRRQAIGIRFLQNCLKETNPCWDKVRAFWETDKTDPDTL